MSSFTSLTERSYMVALQNISMFEVQVAPGTFTFLLLNHDRP